MLQIVIPAFNEEARLPRTLRELRRYVRENRALLGEVEVIVVDNASTDATTQVALAAHTSALPVRVVACPTRGKGAAVAAGIAVTTAPVVGFMDADGATRLSALVEATRLLALGHDVAIGSRGAHGAVAEVRHSRLRESGAHWYRTWAQRVVPGVSDTQCGFKIMDGDLAREACAELRTHGFSFDVELLARLRRRGARLAEFPVEWADVPGSTFEPLRHGAASFVDLARISWRLRGATAVVSVPRFAPAIASPAPAVAVEA
ncbi:glycosyltransferase [Nocardioides sp. R-C-SC26]|uniref:glycosyltransferase n=1 Tax=Nocardioides sp. R-C-SC26 TaxID=2870414 RepID=UPI001E3E7E08|nr:glycosyltransferase [Nocardioides sp. R-C-SC26]